MSLSGHPPTATALLLTSLLFLLQQCHCHFLLHLPAISPGLLPEHWEVWSSTAPSVGLSFLIYGCETLDGLTGINCGEAPKKGRH